MATKKVKSVKTLIQESTGLSKLKASKLWSDYYSTKFTIRDLAKKYGVNRDVLFSLNLKKHRETILNQLVEELYMGGLERSKISEKLGVTVRLVQTVIERTDLYNRRNNLKCESLISDEWRTIAVPGAKKNYSVGNFNGEVKQNSVGFPVSQFKGTDGYLYCSITFDNGKDNSVAVHRIVAYSYCDVDGYTAGSKEHAEYIATNELTVNHKDGDKYNNGASNLEWLSRSENTIHAHRTGLVSQSGEDNNSSRLKNKDVEEICKLILEGKRNIEILELVPEAETRFVVSQIRMKRTWNHISDKYFATPIKSKRGNN